MKKHIINTCLLLGLSGLNLQAENLVKNGDFESGSGNAFSETPPWYNMGVGLNQGASARSEKAAVIAGTYSASVIDRYNTTEDKPDKLAFCQKTDYIIEQGDSFALSFDWRPADQWWQKSRDAVRFVLYATGDDKIGGPVIWSQQFTTPFVNQSHELVQTFSESSSEVNSEAVGRVLFVSFFGIDTVNGEEGNPHWARVDNIDVQVLKNQ